MCIVKDGQHEQLKVEEVYKEEVVPTSIRAKISIAKLIEAIYADINIDIKKVKFNGMDIKFISNNIDISSSKITNANNLVCIQWVDADGCDRLSLLDDDEESCRIFINVCKGQVTYIISTSFINDSIVANYVL